MNVYLDNAATTAIDKQVVAEMVPYLEEHFGNPSSTHAHGRAIKAVLENCRKTVAELLGASPAEIFFTSGGTESDNTAIRCTVRERGIAHIISSPLEHHAVLHTVEDLAQQGLVQLHLLSVNAQGDPDLEELEALLQKHPNALVTLMHGNNEIGNITDIASVGKLCEQNGAYFHSDTVQTIGHFPLNLSALPVDAIAASAHKFHGPKGIGLLYLRKGSRPQPFITGGGQEREMRGGTENIYGIVGLTKALSIAIENMEHHRSHILQLKKRMMEKLEAAIPGVAFNGRSADLENSLYTVLNARIPPNDKSGMLLFMLDLKGISVSGGSACSSGAATGSHVIQALQQEAGSTPIRFSFSKFNTAEEIDYTVAKLAELLS